jgi:hypothetical protein
MTIIAYDGETLCVDGAASHDGVKYELTKVWLFKGCAITGVGDASQIAVMRSWYEAGAVPAEFPVTQRIGVPWCQLIVVDHRGLKRYDREPVPIDHEHHKCAFGAGKDFAYGALAVGATAELAVHAVSQFVPDCGHSSTTYQWKVANETTISKSKH